MDATDPSPLETRIDEIRDGRVNVPFGFDELERRALEALPDRASEYARVGAGSGGTRRANEAAFAAWRVVPRVLRDVSRRSMATELFGVELPAPVALAPIGRQTRYHEDGELATVRAAAELGLPFTAGTAAAHPIEAIAGVDGGPLFFQLYWLDDADVTASIVRRAEEAGCSAILVTVDTVANRWIPSILRAEDRSARVLPNVAHDPVAREKGLNDPGDVRTVDALTWADLEGLARSTDLPVVVKGVSHPADARLAAEHGAAGVVVSNHGGRSVDGAAGTLDLLPLVADEVGADLTVLVDGGIRGGVDAFKALALGADAVLVGRPFVYGLAVAGEAGVYEVLHNLLAGLDSAVGMAGYRDVGAVSREALVSAATLAAARRGVDAWSDWGR